jgi:hypothetical protein
LQEIKEVATTSLGIHESAERNHSEVRVAAMKFSRAILGVGAQFAVCAFLLGQTPTPQSRISQNVNSVIAFDAPGAGKGAGQGTTPKSINDVGEITGYYNDSASVLHGFVRHKDGSFTTFDAPGASKQATLGTLPQSINKDGDITGHFFTDPNGVRHSFVRHRDGTILKFDPPGSAGTVARGINDLGEFAGNYVTYDVAHAFLGRKDNSFTKFDPPGSSNTAPQGINGRGDVAGYYADAAGGLHGFVRRKDGTYAKFDVPGSNASEGKGTLAMGINSEGEVVGYYHTGPNTGIHAFLRRKDGTFDKFDPPGTITDTKMHVDEEGYILRPTAAAMAINEAGEVAGYFGDTVGVVHGFVRRKDGTFITFDAPGAARSGNLGTFSESVNNAGDVTGYYYVGADAVLRGFVFMRSRGSSAGATTELKK